MIPASGAPHSPACSFHLPHLLAGSSVLPWLTRTPLGPGLCEVDLWPYWHLAWQITTSDPAGSEPVERHISSVAGKVTLDVRSEFRYSQCQAHRYQTENVLIKYWGLFSITRFHYQVKIQHTSFTTLFFFFLPVQICV